jgi:hypothetical protein
VKLAAFEQGFSLEAGTHLHENDRLGLEHLCHGLRPPLALSYPGAEAGQEILQPVGIAAARW